MNKQFFSLLIFSLCLGFITSFTLTSCSSDNKASEKVPKTSNTTTTILDQTTRNESKARILFFGNSLTAGYNLEEANSFPSLIQNRLDSLGLNYVAINAGLSGETTAGGLNRLDWVMEQPIDIFVLELGPNDVLRGFDLTSTKANLQAIIDKLKAKYPEVKLVIAGMQAPPNLGLDYTTEFKNIYIDLAKNNDAALIPFLLDGVAAQPELNLADGIHPNVEGQKIVMENVWVVLKEVL